MTLPASAIALAWYRVAMIASDRESAYSRTTDQGHAADLLGFYASQVQKAVAKAAPGGRTAGKDRGRDYEDSAALVRALSDAASSSHVWLIAGINEIGRTPKMNAA
jgi:hypothetical protein